MEVTDLSYLEEASGGMNEFIVEMIEMFLDQTDDYLVKIKKAISEQDWKEVKAASHKMKPTLSMIGMQDAYIMMESLEKDAGNQTNLESASSRIDKIQQDCAQAYKELKSKIEKYK